MFTGTGTAGAYHAGVWRALDEAGIKVDLVAAHGVGVGAALLAAIGNGEALWGEAGLWQNRGVSAFYRLRGALRAVLWVAGIGTVVVMAPLAVLATGLGVYPVAYFLSLVSPAAGAALVAAFDALVAGAFRPDMLPTILPRAAMIVIGLVVAVAVAGAARELLQRRGRREGGPWWARVVGIPWSASGAVRCFEEGLAKALGTARTTFPSPEHLSRRYAEVLAEHVGTPGFRELVVTVHDVDARADLTFGMLAPDHHQAFFAHGRPDGWRADAQMFDLGREATGHVVDVLRGALSLPVLTEGVPIAFAVDGPWRGEVHRLCDRPGCLGDLLDQVAAAGARQVLLVSPWTSRGRPHSLSPHSLAFRGRVGEYLAAAEVAAVQEAVSSRRQRFDRVFEIAPGHNPIGPLDFTGAWDERSDRRVGVPELVARGYEDAYHQFIELVAEEEDEAVGADGPTGL